MNVILGVWPWDCFQSGSLNETALVSGRAERNHSSKFKIRGQDWGNGSAAGKGAESNNLSSIPGHHTMEGEH